MWQIHSGTSAAGLCLAAGVWVRPAHGDGSAERAQSSEVAEVRGRFFLVSTALSGRAPSLRLRSALD